MITTVGLQAVGDAPATTTSAPTTETAGPAVSPLTPDLLGLLLEAQGDLGIGLAIWDGHRFEYVNEAYCSLTGYTHDELLAFDSVRRLIAPEHLETMGRLIDDRLAGRTEQRFSEVKLLHRLGHVLDVEIATRNIQTAAGRRFLSLLRDVSDQRAHGQRLEAARAELEERVAERTLDLARANERLKELDRLKSEFLATMSHELRTPLNSIIGFATLLLDEMPGPLNGEQRRQLDQVLASGNHLLELINDVLDITKIEAGQAFVNFETASLAAIVHGVTVSLQPLIERKKLKLEIEDLGAVPLMLTDVRKVRQIVLNLLNNAIKFTRKGSVRIRATSTEDGVSLHFTDTGIGIRKDDLKLLFQPFRQLDSSSRRSFEGTGLGLYLSRKLARLIGGDIEVTSTYGKGSQFTLVLPTIPVTPV